MMFKASIAIAALSIFAALSPFQAHAAGCTAIPYSLSNGNPADATQVMGNFSYLGGCAAPLSAPAFTGSVTVNGNPVIDKIVSHTFTSNGTYTPETGTQYAFVRAWGAGGGSGGCAGGSSGAAVSGPGGGGGYAEKLIASPLTETVTVGASGAGGAAGNNYGATGGATSFGSIMSAGGGGGGGGGGNFSSIGNGGTPGAGGTASGGDLNVNGGSGNISLNLGLQTEPASGGGSYGFPPISFDFTSQLTYAVGGPAMFCNTTSNAGTAGAPGLVIIWDYISD